MKSLTDYYGASFVDDVNGAITCKRKGGELDSEIFRTLVKAGRSIFDVASDHADGKPFWPTAVDTEYGWVKIYGDERGPFCGVEATIRMAGDMPIVEVWCNFTEITLVARMPSRVVSTTLEVIAKMFECFRAPASCSGPSADPELRIVTELYIARARTSHLDEDDRQPIIARAIVTGHGGIYLSEVKVYE